jgi:hypothetical protein
MATLVALSNKDICDKITKGISMKKTIITFLVGLLIQQFAVAQGTTYLSSLSQNATGNLSVGSDSWMAADFITGNNIGGYVLDSVQLGMASSSGNPTDFSVMIYNNGAFPVGVAPGNSLASLNGSANPSAAGIYTYAPASSLMLSPNTDYFIVLTAGTAVDNGAYNWRERAYPPSGIDNWRAGNGVLHSSNGTSAWSATPYLGIAQFSITATAIPEPSWARLLLFGSGVLFYVRKRRST